jgi:CHAD domain-containing protein
MPSYAAAQVRKRLKKLVVQLRHASEHSHDPDAIHDLRVSARRFLQSLKVFGQFFDRQSSRKMRRRVRRVMDLSGEARNCDIALELLDLAGFHHAKCKSQLRRRRKLAEETLAALLSRWHKRRLHEHWSRHLSLVTGVSGDWDCARPVDVNAHRALPGLAKEFFAAGTVTARARPDYERLHQFRLVAKRFRYTLEMFEPVFGLEIARGVKELRGLQDELGAVNDCITALSLIAANPDAVAAIEKLLAGRESALRSFWREHFDARQQAWWLDWLSRSSIETKPDLAPAKKQIAREGRSLHARKSRAA